MTTITKDFVEINLSTDELMLKELERRDGIYSFIFHELEVPRMETSTSHIPSAKFINSNYTTTTKNTLTTTTKATSRDDDDTSNTSIDNNNNNGNDSNDSDDLADEQKIKTQSKLMQQITTTNTSTGMPTVSTASTTTTTRMNAFTSSVTTSFINRFPPIGSSASAISAPSSAATTTIIVPSLFTTTPLPTTSTHPTTLCFSNTLPCLPSLSGMSMRSYHDYLKTWHPPPSLVYDNPKLYTYMANCGFRVRLPTPRFSHITAPLVRNRRHALKETPEYKRMYDAYSCTPVPDLRELFPHDPDVHAPFAMTMEVTTSVLSEGDEIGSVEFDDGCCGHMVLIEGAEELK